MIKNRNALGQISKSSDVSVCLTPEQRFWKYVKKTKSCWLWTACKDATGYGRFRAGITDRAHRFSYKLHKGKIPNGLIVCHSCDNPPCVNPSHLWLGTNKDNYDDMTKKGRRASFLGENNPKAKLTNRQVEQIRKLRKTGKYTLMKLAEMFDISFSTIGYITTYKSWSNLK